MVAAAVVMNNVTHLSRRVDLHFEILTSGSRSGDHSTREALLFVEGRAGWSGRGRRR